MAFDQAKVEQIKSEVCRRLSAGETLSAICRTEGYPDPSTIWMWRDQDPQFFKAIARAREVGYDVIADDCASIADDGSRDYVIGEDGFVLNHDHIQRSKLRVDTRLKLLAKWDPKRYGDRLHTDNDTRVEVVIRDLTKE